MSAIRHLDERLRLLDEVIEPGLSAARARPADRLAGRLTG